MIEACDAIPRRQPSRGAALLLFAITISAVALAIGCGGSAAEDGPNQVRRQAASTGESPFDNAGRQLCERTKSCQSGCGPGGVGKTCVCTTLCRHQACLPTLLGQACFEVVGFCTLSFQETCDEHEKSCPAGDGDYCGARLGQEPGTLYHCEGGNITVTAVCDNGCLAGTGASDDCAPPPGGAPSCPEGDGLYCGGNGIPGDPDVLYRCVAGTIFPVQSCLQGCARMPPGFNDTCAGDAGPGTRCPNGDGLYCGGDGVPGEPNTLYSCAGGALSIAEVCAGGCAVMPAGVNDQCLVRGSCPSGDGLYCGGDGVAGDTSTLYLCSGGVLTIQQGCSNGCHDNPPGVNDQCNGSSSGGPCPSGDGLYCGGDGVAGDSGILYQCSGGALTPVQTCTNGCQVNPPGVNDQCTGAGAGSCPSGNGLYCGGDGITGDSSVLYQCVDGALSVVQTCTSGCQVNPPGVNDQCAGPGGGSPCPSGNGLYCGGDGVTGDPSTLYQCTSGTLNVVQVCGNGCQVNPPGVNDQCAPFGPSSCPSGNGLYCGGDGIVGSANVLYQCSNGTLSVVRTCPNGCRVNPPGVDDGCV
jgi:hypothetical protein